MLRPRRDFASITIRLLIDEDFVVPPTWPNEVANSMLALVRCKQLAPNQAAEIIRDIDALHILIENPDYRRTTRSIYPLASHHDLSVYDASYLELAKRRKLPLVTFDNQLRAAAKKAKVKAL